MSEGAVVNGIYRRRNGISPYLRCRVVDRRDGFATSAVRIERADSTHPVREWVDEPWFLRRFELVHTGWSEEGTG